MFSFLKKTSGRPDLPALINEGATVIDVRSPEEFRAGHFGGAVNIPLQELSARIGKYEKNEVIILCCASGMRSARAASALKAGGYNRVYDAGSWMNL
jgi:phage shock protein E